MFKTLELGTTALTADSVAVRFMDELLPSGHDALRGLGERVKSWVGTGLPVSEYDASFRANLTGTGGIQPFTPGLDIVDAHGALLSPQRFNAPNIFEPNQVSGHFGFLHPDALPRLGEYSTFLSGVLDRSSQPAALAMLRSQAGRAYDVTRLVDNSAVDSVMSDFNRVVDLKSSGKPLANEDLLWETRRPNGLRGNPLFDAISERRDDFKGVFGEFHDRAYISGKQAVGEFYVRSGESELRGLQKLVDEGQVDRSRRVQQYLSRYGRVGHFKVLRDDVKDPAAFERAFSLPEGKIAALPEKSVVLHSLYNDWGALSREVNRNYPEQLQGGQTRYMQDLQALGMANFLTVLRHGDVTGRSVSLDEFLNHMNAAASLDAPLDAFARLPYSHPTVQNAIKLDWHVIKSGVHIFNRDREYAQLLREGTERFEKPMN